MHSFNIYKNIYTYRYLLLLLVRRELKVRYKSSYLGFFWGFAKPLSQLLIYYLVLGHFLGAARSIPQFAIFIFTGITLWQFISEIVTSIVNAPIVNSPLIKKANLPSEIYALAAFCAAFFNFALQLTILLIAALLSGTLTFGTHLLWGVVAILIAVLWAGALGMLLSGINVYMKDVAHIVDILLILLMWASPIVYFWQFAVSALREMGATWQVDMYINNPLTLAVIAFQNAIWAHGSTLAANIYTTHVPMPDGFLLRCILAIILGAIALSLAHLSYKKLARKFAEAL